MDAPAEVRKRYQGSAGFALWTDVQDKLVADIEPIQLEKIKSWGAGELGISFYQQTTFNRLVEEEPSALSLYAAMSHIRRVVPDNDEDFRRRYGVTAEEEEAARHSALGHGFNDMDFAWHASAGIANAMADYCVAHNVITQEQKHAFTLHDWAAVIGADWFRHTLHSLALTENGVYNSFGKAFDDYTPGAFRQKLLNNGLLSPDEDEWVPEASSGLAPSPLGVMLRPREEVVMKLRARLKQSGDTIGCPVARHAIRLSSDMTQTDPHIRALLERGTCEIDESKSTTDTVRITQRESAIDKTMLLFAGQLRRYEDAWGMPLLGYMDRPSELAQIPVEHLRR